MLKLKMMLFAVLLGGLFSSCQAIGNIFSAGVWVGLTIAVIVIIILVAVFRRRA
jgi:hypothetical protein